MTNIKVTFWIISLGSVFTFAKEGTAYDSAKATVDSVRIISMGDQMIEN